VLRIIPGVATGETTKIVLVVVVMVMVMMMMIMIMIMIITKIKTFPSLPGVFCKMYVLR